MNTQTYEKQLFETIQQNKVSGIIITDPYLITGSTGLEFPFAGFYPEKPLLYMVLSDGSGNADQYKQYLISPADWADAVQQQGWKDTIKTYNGTTADSFAAAASIATEVLGEAFPESSRSGHKQSQLIIGYHGLTLNHYFKQLLEDSLAPAVFKEITDCMDTFIKVKNNEQQKRLATAAEQLDFGIVAALQHLEGSLEDIGYTAAEFCERIRVHVYECGGTAGGLAFTANGRNTRQWYGIPAGKYLPGELVRIEATSCYKGFWANAARMITIGQANRIQKQAYRENMVLKDAAVQLLKPGTTCSEIYRKVLKLASEQGIDLLPDFPMGHGIGITEYEAPYITPNDKTTLMEGMCIALGIYTGGPEKELICSKDTFIITSRGADCISDYHVWDNLYQVTGFRSAH